MADPGDEFAAGALQGAFAFVAQAEAAVGLLQGLRDRAELGGQAAGRHELPVGDAACTASTSLRLAATTRRASTVATPRPTSPPTATTLSTMSLGAPSMIICRVMATTPPTVATTVTTATTASITPIDRSRSSRIRPSPATATSRPSPAVTATISSISGITAVPGARSGSRHPTP